MQLDSLCFQFNLYSQIASFLPYKDLVRLESVNKQFNSIIRGSETLWRETAIRTFQDKEFIPSLCRRLITPGNKIGVRNDLNSMSIKELKGLARIYACNISQCFEKSDIIAVLDRRESKKMVADECLSRFAVRIAVIDSTRNCITLGELCSIRWNLRVRADGPLAQLKVRDPWWNESLIEPGAESVSTTHVQFHMNGKFEFKFTGVSPIELMFDEQSPEFEVFELEHSGNAVNIFLGPRPIREQICRHPVNWGWILQSYGTVWTGYPMPRRFVDSLLEDDAVLTLIDSDLNHGFIV